MPQDFTAAQVLTAAQMDTLSGAVDGYATTATAAGTTTLTTASLYQQFFTGSTTQSVVMPVTTTLYVGQKWRIVNNSSGIVTIKTSDSTTIYAAPAGSDTLISCILASGATAASWDYKDYKAAGSAPALIKIQASSFSAVANTSTTFDGVFTSTYKKYLVVFSECASSVAPVVVNIQTRVSGVTSATGYYGIVQTIDYASTITYISSNNATSLGLGDWSTTAATSLELLFTNVGNSSQRPTLSGTGWAPGKTGFTSVGGFGQAEITTGFIVTPASGTITGTITVYGLAN